MKLSIIISVVVCGLAATTCLGSPVEKVDKITVVEQQTVTMPDHAGKYEEEVIRKLNFKCSQNDFNSCGLLKIVTYINKLFKKASIELTDDIEIRKTSQAKEEISYPSGRSSSSNSGGSSSNGSQDDETDAFDLIASKVYAFIKSRSIKWKFLPEDDVVVSAKEDENGSLSLGLSIERSDSAVQDGNNI